MDLFVCFDVFRVPEEDPDDTVAACSLLQLSRNTSHTKYMCTVDMTELLADFKVRVDVTETANRQHMISKGFYMAENSKYKNDGFDKYCLSLCVSARIVWARSECGSQWCGAVFGVHSSEQGAVLLFLPLETTETCLTPSFRAGLAPAFSWGNSLSPWSSRW